MNWSELRFKSIEVRSFSSITGFENKLYIYGGQSNRNLDSFTEINITNLQTKQLNNKPGPLAKHASCTKENFIYLFGGQTNIGQSNKIWKYNVIDDTWIQIPQNFSYPRPYDNFGFTLVEQNHAAIFGDFYVNKLMNSLYLYDFKTNEFLVLSQKQGPSPREGCSLNYINKKYYVFGGTDHRQKLGDFWEFNQENKQWLQIQFNIEPKARSGHTMVAYKNKLILFGGIHTITWEMDDVWVYDQGWKVIENDSSRKVSKIQIQRIAARSVSPQRSQAETKISVVLEQKLKQKEIDKKNMIKLFEVDDLMAKQFLQNTPVTSQLRTSLRDLGCKVDLQYSDFGKQSISKFIIPYEGKVEKLGKKPCPRDGHAACVYENNMFIFGGDRHMMQYSDLYSCNIQNL